MKTIPSSEFTKAPAKYLEEVFRGESFLLTRYGRAYVVLSPPPAEAPQKDPAAKAR